MKRLRTYAQGYRDGFLAGRLRELKRLAMKPRRRLADRQPENHT